MTTDDLLFNTINSVKWIPTTKFASTFVLSITTKADLLRHCNNNLNLNIYKHLRRIIAIHDIALDVFNAEFYITSGNFSAKIIVEINATANFLL